MKGFSERLKEIRKFKGISQGELAKLTGLTQTVISSYECDKSKPKFEHIVPIAQALDITIDTLFGIENLNDSYSLMQFLYTTRDRLKKSKNYDDRISALHFDLVIEDMEKEQKRREDI